MKPILLTILSIIAGFLQPLHGLSERPNIIYILADDMGYGDVSALNPEGKINTPHIDRIANEGMVFTDAHTSSSVCTPSRYSILTGRYSWRTLLKHGVMNGESTFCLIDPNRVTVANVLKNAGYNTAMIGKWHLGWEWAAKPGVEVSIEKRRSLEKSWIDINKPIKQGPTSFGFDYFFGICGSLDMTPTVWVENDTPLYKYWSENNGNNASTHLPEYARRTVDFINRQSPDKPFFIYMPLTSPHTPMVPNEEFKGKGISNYADFCIETDYRVGQVLDALDKKGFTDNTLVIFTTDNGCTPKAKVQELEKDFGHYPSYKYRGYKRAIWDGGHRVPFVVRWPNVINAGSNCSHPVGVFDLIRTAAEITGQTLSENTGEDSISLLPAFKGEMISSTARAGLIHHSSNGLFAVRKGDWKLCFTSGAGGNDGSPRMTPPPGKRQPFQLYNMAKDPGEKNNLYGTMPEKEKELISLMKAAVLNGRTTPGEKQSNDTGDNWKETAAFMSN